jgi:putative aldouronate transport system substrate-binding protein
VNKIQSSGDTSVSYTAIEPIAAQGINQKDIYTDNQRSVGGGITITTSAENPEAIYAYHDWAVTPEGQYTIGFGPEGELWEYGSNGMPVLKEGKSLILSPEELSELPIYAYFTIGHSNTYNEAKMAINRTLPEDQRDWLIAAQDQITFRHTKDVTEFVNVDTDVDTDEAIIYVDAREILREAYINMITAESDNAVKALYDSTKEQIYSMGFEKVIKVLDEKWKANKEILGAK